MIEVEYIAYVPTLWQRLKLLWGVETKVRTKRIVEQAEGGRLKYRIAHIESITRTD